MPEIRFRHEINCDDATYFGEVFFDAAYNKELYGTVLKFPKHELLEDRVENGKRHRKVRLEPPAGGLPGPIAKLIGDRASYVESGVFDEATRRYKFSVVPNALADKMTTEGELWCESIGPNKVARCARVKVEVRVPFVGGKVEEKILGDMKNSYEAAAKFANEFLARRAK